MGKRSRSKLGRQRDPAPAPARRAAVAAAADGHGRGLWMVVLLVAVVAAVVYLNGLPGGFVFDDKLIQRDPRIHGQTSFWTIFVTDYWYKYIGTSADLYRPLTIASYALNYAVAGLSSPAFHAVNIALHAVVSVVVLLLVDALLHNRMLAVASALLFATHPIHTEAVTGIVGRAEILTALFLLLALYLHARRYTLLGRGRALWLPVAAGAYFCALLCKETAIVGPGLLLVVDYVAPRGAATGARGDDGDRPRWDLRRVAPILALYVGVAVVYLAIRFSVVGQLIQKPPPRSYLMLFGQPWTMRLYTALEIFAIYLRLLIFPVTLSADYSYRQVPLLATPNLAAAIGFVAAIAVGAGFVWAVRRRVWPAVFAIGSFAVAYALVGNFPVPLQVLVAERLMYLPSVGFCVGLAWLWVEASRAYARYAGAGWPPQVPAALLAVVVVLYGARTFVRNFDWRNTQTLYAATVAASPECFAAHFNYSAVLLREGKRQLALEHLLAAYEIRQDHYPSLVNLSSVYLMLGEPEKAREFALRGLKVRPNGRELKGLLKSAEARLRVGSRE